MADLYSHIPLGHAKLSGQRCHSPMSFGPPQTGTNNGCRCSAEYRCREACCCVRAHLTNSADVCRLNVQCILNRFRGLTHYRHSVPAAAVLRRWRTIPPRAGETVNGESPDPGWHIIPGQFNNRSCPFLVNDSLGTPVPTIHPQQPESIE